MTTLNAVFDGSVLLPEEPLHLEPNARVRITVEAVAPSSPAGPTVYRGRELDWIQSHGQELRLHCGKWVVLEGETIVASDADYFAARQAAKTAGLARPLLFRVPDDSVEAFMGV